MKLYALVYSMNNVVPMIFHSHDIAEIFPNDDESFLITLKNGQDYWCKQIGFNKDLLSLDFSGIEVANCDHDIYGEDFIKCLMSLRNSGL